MDFGLSLAAAEATLQLLLSGSRFLVTTHDFSDGDGVGSQMALFHGLRRLGKTVHAINPGPTPEKFSLVDPDSHIRVYDPAQALPPVDAVLILDTNELKMTGALAPALQALGCPLVFIDHHVGDSLPPGPHLVDETYAATGELVYGLLGALGVELDPAIATALYVAIVTDTAGFRYKRTSPRSHRIAAELLEHGVQPEQVHHTIFARESVAKTRLLGWTLERLQTSADGKVAWMQIPSSDRLRFGATIEDTESYIGFLTLVRGMKIAALFREEDDDRIKVSLRGMAGTPVIEIAQGLGGGGHRYAAGARVTGSLPEVIQRTLAACSKAVR